MEFFKWKESFEIGIDELDRQHRTFLEYLNECYAQAAKDNHARVDPDMVARLRRYATMHFHCEEEMLRFASYQDMERQALQHTYFERQILALEAEHQAAKSRNIESVFVLLREWFLKHILVEDKRFVPLVKEGRFSGK